MLYFIKWNLRVICHLIRIVQAFDSFVPLGGQYVQTLSKASWVIIRSYWALGEQSSGSSAWQGEQGVNSGSMCSDEHLQFSVWDHVGRNGVTPLWQSQQNLARQSLFCSWRATRCKHGCSHSSKPLRWWAVQFVLDKGDNLLSITWYWASSATSP